FFAARIPWSFKNFIWGLVFLLTYLGWTLIHFFAQIGTPRGCELYIDPECPIYDAFDWNMPMMTTIITIFALVGYAVLAGLYTAFVRCRKCCFPTPVGEVETKDGPQNIETIENVELRWPEQAPLGMATLLVQIATSNWFPPLVYAIFNGIVVILRLGVNEVAGGKGLNALEFSPQEACLFWDFLAFP
ncbi:unnamed protein product, partial [Cladocopium goreaui]